MLIICSNYKCFIRIAEWKPGFKTNSKCPQFTCDCSFTSLPEQPQWRPFNVSSLSFYFFDNNDVSIYACMWLALPALHILPTYLFMDLILHFWCTFLYCLMWLCLISDWRPLDLCDSNASTPDLVYQGSHAGGMSLSNQGSVPSLPTSGVNSSLPGSSGMALGGNLSSASGSIAASVRYVLYIAGDSFHLVTNATPFLVVNSWLALKF